MLPRRKVAANSLTGAVPAEGVRARNVHQSHCSLQSYVKGRRRFAHALAVNQAFMPHARLGDRLAVIGLSWSDARTSGYPEHRVVSNLLRGNPR